MKPLLTALFLASFTISLFALTTNTVTVAPSGGSYTTLALAEDGEDATGDLVANDEVRVIEISGDWSGTDDTSAVTIAGWTTDATRYLRITVASASRHAGVWSSAKYLLTVANNVPLTLSEDYIRLEGLQIESTSPTANSKHCITTGAIATQNACEVYISSCIIRGHAHGTYTQIGLAPAHNYWNIKVWNSLLYNFAAITGTRPISVGVASVTVTNYSVVAIGGDVSFRQAAGTFVCKNCYAGGSSSTDYGGTITKTTCASEDSTGSTGLTGIALSTDTFTNVSGGSENFHLVAGSGLIDVGTDTSGEAAPFNFTTDIDGVTRSGTWDIGADEYVAASGTTYNYVEAFERP